MDIFVTMDTMLSKEPLLSFLQSNTKKERTLYVYHNSNSQLSFPDAKVLLDAAKKMTIDFVEVNNTDDFAFSLGFLAGTLKAKNPIYTILPPESQISDSIREMYHLEEYKPLTAAPKKRNRPATQTVQKISTDLQHEVAEPAHDLKTVASNSQKETPNSDPAAPPEEKKPENAVNTPADLDTDPIFLSADAETFFNKQLGNSEHYKDVAVCMKDSAGNKSKAEELIRNRIRLSGADMERIVNAVRQKWNLLYDCLFIRRR